jgi:transcriptional regulator
MTNREEKYRNRIELLQGTLDMLILHAVEARPLHGYAIAQIIRGKSREALQIETGSLYPALHRLERQGWVSSEWKLTESRQRAKFYALTELGRKQLATESGRWQRMVEAIAAVMTPDEAQA